MSATPAGQMKPLQLPEQEQIRAQYEELFYLLMAEGWEPVSPETLVSCPVCRAAVPFPDAAQHAEVLHPDLQPLTERNDSR